MNKLEKDQHGQPIRIFKANFENNISKAIDQLSGICSGILADGIVSEVEAHFFADWVRTHSKFEPVWPFTEILERIDHIFKDGKCDDEEREELRAIMQSICGQTAQVDASETFSTTLPIDSPPPDPIEISGQKFAITGRFAFGTRQKVFEAISSLGGTASDTPPSKDTNYLVIGFFASRDWANTNYGRKIERGVELRAANSGISIVSEEHWRKFIP